MPNLKRDKVYKNGVDNEVERGCGAGGGVEGCCGVVELRVYHHVAVATGPLQFAFDER